MPLYEDKHNAQNRIQVSAAALKSTWIGTQAVTAQLLQALQAGKGRLALDGWYGVDFAAVVRHMQEAGVQAQWIAAHTLYKDLPALKAYKQPNVTDDPGFGCVNTDGALEELLADDRVADALRTLQTATGPVVVYGYGAAAAPLRPALDTIVYLDKTMQTMQWQMWDGKLIPFGLDRPDDSYNWKEFNYCDFYLLYRHKKALYDCMDYYVEAIDPKELKMVARAAYDEIIATAVTYPIKQVQIFQPGPWGAYRYRDLWDIPGLACSAWNKMSGPELSVLLDFGAAQPINLPLINLLQYNAQVTGPKISQAYPDLFPLDIWLDDGYFDTPQPAERISMPIHNHPDSSYVARHFKEPLGRYETYYIAEAYEGANTWMGYHDGCDLEAWEQKCRNSDNLTPIADWKDYVCNWKSNVGDLYLIPPGTAHGHGGNQMVLEMDTAPSIAGTEYSFFQYDFARNSWDDEKKTMTGKPLKMHLEHGFDNERYRRASYVSSSLRARPEIVSWNKSWYMDRYSSLPEMPFDVERIFFDQTAEHTTDGKFLQILTLTVGHRITVRSKADPQRKTEIERLQCVAVPACFGDYELASEDGSACTVVCFHMKDG